MLLPKGIKDFILEFKEPFDPKTKSVKLAKERIKDRGEKAIQQAVEEEVAIIKTEWKEAQNRGLKLHKQIQDKRTKIKTCVIEGHSGKKSNNIPDPSSNKLKNNTTYIEKSIVSDKYKLLGYADEVNVVNNYINIEDIKTTKVIYNTSAIKLKNGFTVAPTYFFSPINKLQDCNKNEAALQLSIYMYLLWLSNKNLKPGKLHIRHIKTNSQDKIVEEILIPVPYLREEVKAMLKNRIQNAV